MHSVDPVKSSLIDPPVLAARFETAARAQGFRFERFGEHADTAGNEERIERPGSAQPLRDQCDPRGADNRAGHSGNDTHRVTSGDIALRNLEGRDWSGDIKDLKVREYQNFDRPSHGVKSG